MPRRVAPLLAMVLAALVAVVHGSVLLGELGFAEGEHLFRALPSAAHLAERVRAFDLAEWWSGVGLGVPFAANPRHGALYPPAYLVALGPLPWALDAVAILHVFWAGLGAALWSRRLGADPFSALVVGGAVASSGTATGALAVHGALFAASWLPWVGGSVDLLASSAGGQRWRAAIRCAAVWSALLLAGGLSAAWASIAIAAAALAARRDRSAIGPAALGAAAATLLAAVLLVPAASAGALAGARGPALGGAALWGALWPVGAGPLVGAPLVALALVALVRRPRIALPLWAAAIGAAVAAAVGLGGHAAAWAMAATVCAGVAAGLGLSSAIESVRRRDLVVAGAVAAAAAIAVIAEVALGPGPRGLPSAIAATALVGALLWARRSGGGASAWAVVGIAVVGLLAWEGRRQVPRAPRAQLAAPPALVAGIPPGRLSRPRRLPGGQDARSAYRLAAANTAARFGFGYLRGEDDLLAPELELLWRRGASVGERLLDLFGAELAALPRTVALPAGLPVLAAVDSVALVDNRHRRPRAFTTVKWRHFVSREALLSELFPPASDMRSGLGLATVHLVGEGEDAPPQGRVTPTPACAIEEPAPEDVRLACRAEAPGYAVLLDAASPGWRAELDGAEVPIERADLVARAVAVGAGDHALRFRYRTPGLMLGALVSALAWLNLVVIMAWLRHR